MPQNLKTSYKLNETQIEQLKHIVPEAFKDGMLDFNSLYDALCDLNEEDSIEMDDNFYGLYWPGKRAAKRAASIPPRGTLVPVKGDGVDEENTKNIYIEGDNLEVLKLLQKSYAGRIKMIYIDPPYNTGNDFIYNDDFSESAETFGKATGQLDEEGIRQTTNSRSDGRFHSKWLNMMYPRLKLAHSLLRDDGVIFISIDDNEVAQLRKICDEIFGEENFVANISWQRTYSSRNDSLGIVIEVEYILVYSKQSNWQPNKLPRTEEMDSKYGSPDNDERLWTSSSISAPGAVTHQGMVYAIQHPFTGEMMYPTVGRHWALGQEQILENMNKWCDYKLFDINDSKKRAEICGITDNTIRKDIKAIILVESLDVSREKAQKILERGKWPYFYFTDGGKGGIRRKTYLDEMEGRLSTNFWPFEETGPQTKQKKN